MALVLNRLFSFSKFHIRSYSQTSTPSIQYRVATSDDYNSVLGLLRQHFYPDEPLTAASEPSKPESEDEKFVLSNLAHGTSILAVSDSKIIGASITGPKFPGEDERILEEASRLPDTYWKKMLIFFATLEKEANVFKKYNVDKAVHGHAMSVDRNCRGNDIGLILTAKAMERAKELGFPVFTVDSTGVHSQRICESLGMDCICVCPLEEYHSSEESQNSVAEKKFVKTYAKRLFNKT